jgi:M6 family metalloprotease-like protein
MRSATYIPLLAAALPGVQALPFSDANTRNGPVEVAPTYITRRDNPSSALTDVPTLLSSSRALSMMGLLPPEHWTTTASASRGWITGVPAPQGGGNATQRPPGYNTSLLPSSDTYTRTQQPTGVPTGWMTGVPAPDSSDPAQQPTHLPTGWVSGIPAPNRDGSKSMQRPPGCDTSTLPSGGWITGVPTPSSDGYIPTHQPSGYDTSFLPTGSWITGVPAPSPSPGPGHDNVTDISSGDYITGVPKPTPSPDDTTNLPPTVTSTPAAPTSTPNLPSCRPEWPTAGYTGTFRAAVIFVDFPDFEATTTVQELWDPIAFAPTELYKTMSYGKLNLELVPLLDKFYRMPSVSSSYGYARGLTTDSHLKYINDALAAVGPDASFADIDTLYIIPPKFASEISFSTSTASDVIALDGSVITSSITFGQDLFFTWGPKTVNHETGHAMGLPDLYPYDGGAIQQFVGGFDMMGVIGGQSPDYMAWHKWRLEWLDESQVVCVVEKNGTSEHRIGPIEVADEARDSPKAIAIPVGGTEYVMVEVRSDMGANKGACGTGVLLYTADSALGSGDAPIKVIDTKLESGGCDASHGGELNDAPLKVGEEWDTGKGVVIRVKSQEWNDYIIEVERKD